MPAIEVVSILVAVLVMLSLIREKFACVPLLLGLSVFQLWTTFPGIGSISACELLAVALLLLRMDRLRDSRTSAVAWLCGLFVLIQVVSLIWSPAPKGGANWILTEVPFIGIYVYSLNTPLQKLLGYLRMGLSAAVVIPAAVYLFRISHAAGLDFYRSLLAKLFIGSGAADLFTSERNNVLDTGKSGGVFVNANSASMTCGVLACLCALAYYYRPSRSLALLCAFNYGAVFATGSKTGLFLGLIAPIAYFSFRSPLSRNALLSRIVGLLAAGTAVFVATLVGAVGSRSSEALTTRDGIWADAFKVIAKAPLAGNGFGGWVESYAPYAFSRGYLVAYPPHNLVLYTWSQSGLLAVIVGFALAVQLLRAVTGSGAAREVKAIYVIAVGWIWLHGMADNTTIFGNVSIAAFIGLATVIATRPAPGTTEPTDSSHTAEPVRV